MKKSILKEVVILVAIVVVAELLTWCFLWVNS